MTSAYADRTLFLPKDLRKGGTERSRRMEVGAISGSRSDHASVANQSLSRRKEPYTYIYGGQYCPRSPPASKHPFTLAERRQDKLLHGENKEKIGKPWF